MSHKWGKKDTMQLYQLAMFGRVISGASVGSREAYATQYSNAAEEKEEYDDDGRLIVRVDSDLDVTVPRLSAIPPHDAKLDKRTKTTDANRVAEFQLRQELKKPNASLYTIPVEDIVHVRTHKQLAGLIDDFHKLHNSANILSIGLDTENDGDRKLATLQLSARVRQKKVTSVTQVRSQRHGHIYKDGQPKQLRQILKLEDSIFVGKSIGSDIVKAANMAGLKNEETNAIAISDSDRLYQLCEAFCHSREMVELWLNGHHTSIFKEISLKIWAQFVNPTKILDKRPHHRIPFKADFSEGKRRISDDSLCYAALDAEVANDAHQEFCRIVGVPLDFFATTVGNENKLKSEGSEKILRKYVEAAHLPVDERDEALISLSTDELRLYDSIRNAIPAIRKMMVVSQKDVLEQRNVKKGLNRITKADRDEENDPDGAIVLIARDPLEYRIVNADGAVGDDDNDGDDDENRPQSRAEDDDDDDDGDERQVFPEFRRPENAAAAAANPNAPCSSKMVIKQPNDQYHEVLEVEARAKPRDDLGREARPSSSSGESSNEFFSKESEINDKNDITPPTYLTLQLPRDS